MFDQAATLLTMKVQQWHPAKQLRDRSKLAIPLKKELDMTPVPVEHHLGTAGEREYSTVKSTTPISLAMTPPRGRLEMLLKKAAAEKARLVSGGINPWDRRHEQLQEEMRFVERSFSHCLK